MKAKNDTKQNKITQSLQRKVRAKVYRTARPFWCGALWLERKLKRTVHKKTVLNLPFFLFLKHNLEEANYFIQRYRYFKGPIRGAYLWMGHIDGGKFALQNQSG